MGKKIPNRLKMFSKFKTNLAQCCTGLYEDYALDLLFILSLPLGTLNQFGSLDQLSPVAHLLH